MYKDYHSRGLEILAFPCNQFMGQEPGSEREIEEVCQLNYGVDFPMHAKIEVNGAGTHPLYARLKAGAPGLLGIRAVKWNFTKFLVDRSGEVLTRYAPVTTPDKIRPAIEKALG